MNEKIERYRKILAVDPGSRVFVELARALLDAGRPDEAEAVCREGLEHHPDAIEAHVLLGRAELDQGRPAVAMDHFEAAVAVDPRGPYAYNLIGEVLVQRGLFRSALPILRTAASLQPGDPQVARWLARAEKAVGQDEEPPPSGVDAPPAPAAEPSWSGDAGEDDAGTDALLDALTSPPPGSGQATAPAGPAWDWQADPGAEAGAAGEDLPFPEDGETRLEFPWEEPGQTGDAPSGEAASDTAAVPAGPPVLDREPEAAAAVPAPPPLPPRPPTQVMGLDLPPLPGAATRPAPAARPAAVDATQVAEAHERALREAAQAAESAPPSWAARHRTGLVVAAVATFLLATAGAVGWVAREASREDTIRERLAQARNGYARGSYASYLAALEALDEALSLDGDHLEARARVAQMQAIVWRTLDPDPARRQRAVDLIQDPALAQAHPDLLLDARYHLVDGGAREEVSTAVTEALADRPDSPVLHFLAGREALAKGEAEAANAHFQKALAALPGDVRTVMALADHFAAQDRWKDARAYYDNVRENVPGHPLAALGAARARLALDEDLETAGRLVAEVAEGGPLAPLERLRLDDVSARLALARGDAAAAARHLKAALDRHPERTDLALRLAEVEHGRFHLPEALAALEVGLAAKADDASLLARRGRVLVDWSRYREALQGLGNGDAPELALVRGVAAYHAGDLDLARKAFSATRDEKGRVPAAAAVHLALLDLSAGAPTRARKTLDRARKATPKDPLVLWARGRWLAAQKENLAAIRSLREAVAEDATAYRALSDLGRAELTHGWTDKALEDAARSVSLNPYHLEGHVLLGEVHLALDEPEAAREAFGRSLALQQTDEGLRGEALALLRQGKVEEAEAQARAAVALDPKDPLTQQVLGKVLLAKGQSTEATQVLGRARRGDSGNPEILTDLGDAWLARGGRSNARRALGYYKEALTAEKRHGRAQWGLGRALLALKDKDAVSALQKATGRLDRPAWRAAAWRDLAQAWQVAVTRPRLDKARHAAWQAVQEEDTAENREVVARILLAESKADTARLHLEKATQLDPRRASAWLLLGQVLQEAGAPEARAAFERVQALDPKSREAREAARRLQALKN